MIPPAVALTSFARTCNVVGAAAVMQQLTDEPGYRDVVAPQAISRVADGQEQFYLNLRVGDEVPE